jgi:flagellar hook-length control protein FliK
VASVAADPSAIAPPMPLPSRSDAGPPAGPSGAFADLLESAAPATPPQPQGPLGARTDESANAPQTNPAAGSGPSGTAPASAVPSTARSKDSRGSKSTGDSADDSNSTANTAVDATAVAGFAVAPFAFASLPNADQTAAASQDAQTASADPTAPTQDSTSDPPDNRKNLDGLNDSTAAGIAAALPGIVPVITVVAPASSTPAGTGPVVSLPSGAAVPADTSSTPSASGPAAGPDVAGPPSQQPDGTGQNNQPASTSVLDLLTGMPSAASAAGEQQLTSLRALASAAANSAAPDRNASSAPIITPDASSATATPAAAVAALNPPPPMTRPAAETQVAAESVDNAAPPRDAGAGQITLPTQVAVRFAAPAHADDDATSDDGTDVLRGFGAANAGAAAMPGSGQPDGAIAPGFTGILATMQAAPGPATAPQHAAVTTDAVPLAAVPIAIVTRAEAGERKFEIRLDPPDLGRIDVQLNVDGSGRATSHLVVDRPATLDLLRRDAPALERALQSAGLTTDNGSLQFSLRDQSFAGREQAPAPPPAPPATASATETDVAPIDAALRRYGAAAGLGSGIDIRV